MEECLGVDAVTDRNSRQAHLDPFYNNLCDSMRGAKMRFPQIEFLSTS
jgi:hypothetical protein